MPIIESQIEQEKVASGEREMAPRRVSWFSDVGAAVAEGLSECNSAFFGTKVDEN